MPWSVFGSALIIAVTWYKVQLDVQVNEWFGDFYNIIQTALGNPNTLKQEDIFTTLTVFIEISIIYVVIAAILEFFIRHFIFRWRTAMNDYYMSHWTKVRHVEGAAQRVQEDTMRFAKNMEVIAIGVLHSVMILIAFLPLLWDLSENINELPFIGAVEHGPLYIAILSSVFGTALLALVGIKLPGLEFNNQRAEAALRKELVLGEDNPDRADPMSIKELYGHVTTNYINMYKHYMYFDLTKWSYLQFSAIFPYVMLAPTIVAGVITLGVMKQIIRAFEKVEGSFQLLVYSWALVVELLSIYKRLKAFETEIYQHHTTAEVAVVTE